MKISLFAFLLLALPLALSAHAEESFHPPQSKAERSLDNILHMAAQDSDVRDYLLGRPHRLKDNDIFYEGVITPELAQATARFERDLVRKECGGLYPDGQHCGYDADPVTCAQDAGDNFYETLEETAAGALILATYRDMSSTKGYRKYRLVMQNGVWALDGIYCYNTDDSFNWD